MKYHFIYLITVLILISCQADEVKDKKVKNLKAIFTEVSFPNHLQNVADISYHHTPNTMKAELPKMPEIVPVYLGHLKPNYQEQLIQEITDLGESRLHIMYADDVRYNFE